MAWVNAAIAVLFVYKIDDAGQFRSAGFRVVLRADRVLHEGVRGDDEEGRHVHRDRHDPDAGEMNEPG